MESIVISSIDDLDYAAIKFISFFGQYPIIAFYGSMGSGKTTFIRALCTELGYREAACSPTFSIINEYRTRKGEVIYHIDLFRLNDLKEALDTGVLDYLESGQQCFIEWPEIIEKYLPENTLKINIGVQADGTRCLTVKS